MLGDPTTQSNSQDDSPSLQAMITLARQFRARHGLPLKKIKLSDATMRALEKAFPTYPGDTMLLTFYGIPLEIDNDLELWECKPVYALEVSMNEKSFDGCTRFPFGVFGTARDRLPVPQDNSPFIPQECNYFGKEV